MNIIGMIAFWIVYAASFCIFKRGSLSKAAWLPCFIIGNVSGVIGNGILMLLYETMDANIALGLAVGGGYLFAQISLSRIFKEPLTPRQYISIFAVTAGMFMLVM